MAMNLPEPTTPVRNDHTFGDQLLSMPNLEGITLIWYDANLSLSARRQLRITKKQLRSINNFVVFHKNEQECVNTIKSIKNEKILLVTCGSGANSLLSSDDKFVHKSVTSVFIFCRKKDKYELLRRTYPKIVGIFTDSDELKSSITNEVTLIQAHCEAFNFYNQMEEKSMVDLTKRSATFLWLLVFKYLVVRMPKDEKAKSQMVETCKKYYHGNKSELKRIQDFSREYRPEHAIRWYTKSSFVYKLVNKALRMEDIEQLYVFRFYISDLCEELRKRHENISEHRSWRLYRGVRLPLIEVQKFQQNVGKLISTNGFLSTSLSKNVAMGFALTRTLQDTEESVLFEIECDDESATFAPAGEDSVHPEEQEILFDLGTTFEVLSIGQCREENAQIDIWVIRVRSTQEGKALAQQYIEGCQKQLEQGTPIEIIWESRLISMGRLEKAIEYHQRLPSSSGVPVDQLYRAMNGDLSGQEKYDEVLEYLQMRYAKVGEKTSETLVWYFMKGVVYLHKGNYDQALREFRDCIPLDAALVGEDTMITASIYKCIGDIHYYKGEYQLALDNFKKSEEIGEKHYSGNQNFFAQLFMDVGNVYTMTGELDRAMECYLKAADLKEKLMPDGDARIYSQMGCTFNSLCDYAKSLEYYQRAAEIMQRKGGNDTKTSVAKLEIKGRMHRLKGELQDALECFGEALKIQMETVGRNHASVGNLHYLKGTALEDLNRNDEALKAYHEALVVQKAVFHDGHRYMASSMYSIGNQYRQKGEFTLAKQYCNQALEMQKQFLPPKHIHTSFSLSHIGKILYDQGEYRESLTYLWSAFKIQKNFSGQRPHRYQALTLITIGDANIKLNIIPIALTCLKQALWIQENCFSSQHPQLPELRRKIDDLELLRIA